MSEILALRMIFIFSLFLYLNNLTISTPGPRGKGGWDGVVGKIVMKSDTAQRNFINKKIIIKIELMMMEISYQTSLSQYNTNSPRPRRAIDYM